jgi:hypothetical protein
MATSAGLVVERPIIACFSSDDYFLELDEFNSSGFNIGFLVSAKYLLLCSTWRSLI